MALRVNTCGCECKNDTTWEPCGDLIPCGDVCPEAPCAYAVLFGCSLPGPPRTRPITILWRECLFGGDEWTARDCKAGSWFNGQAECDHLGFAENSTGHPDNHITPTSLWHQYFPPVWDDNGTPTWDLLQFGCDVMGYGEYRNQTYRCGWYDHVNLPEECSSPTYWDDFLNANTDVIWKLTVISEGVAQLVGYVNGVRTVIYDCDDFDCLGRSTFVMFNDASYYGTSSGATHGLPARVCVVPYSSNWLSPCETKADACACGDAGWTNICLDISGVICGGLNGQNPPVELPRKFAMDEIPLAGSTSAAYWLDLSGFVSAPSPAPCGFFAAYTTGNNCAPAPLFTGPSLAVMFLVWCDGEDWKVQVYCLHLAYDYGGAPSVSSATLICDTTADISTLCPDGVRFTFDCGAIDSDCCPECDTTVDWCDCEIPTVLYGTITMATCDDVDGTVVTLTWNATTELWEGTFDAGDCGTLRMTANAPATGCTWELAIMQTAGSANCVGALTTSPSWQCPLVSVESNGGSWNSGNPGCSCCTNLDAITITLTP